MTRQQRRSKTLLVKKWKKLGYSLRNGILWERWRFYNPSGKRQLVPIFHADYELACSESEFLLKIRHKRGKLS